MRPHHFFIEDGADDSRHVINSDLLLSLRIGPLPDRDDVEVAVGLARLVHDELESYGTSGGGEMSNDDIRDAILALRAVLGRIGIGEFDRPFRDFRELPDVLDPERRLRQLSGSSHHAP